MFLRILSAMLHKLKELRIWRSPMMYNKSGVAMVAAPTILVIDDDPDIRGDHLLHQLIVRGVADVVCYTATGEAADD